MLRLIMARARLTLTDSFKTLEEMPALDTFREKVFVTQLIEIKLTLVFSFSSVI